MNYKLQFAELLPYWNVLLQGLIFTIVLTVVSTVAGIAVGTAGASARTFGPVWLGRIVAVYVELIRNTPFIVQLFFIFFGLPALGVKLSETTAAFLAMVINLGAYSTEIIRAGIEAVPKGHIEAGLSLAMTKWEVLRRIVLNQAFRKIYPALSSQIIIVMLGSAVVFATSGAASVVLIFTVESIHCNLSKTLSRLTGFISLLVSSPAVCNPRANS